MKKKVLFIYNPGSGKPHRFDLEKLVRHNLDLSQFDYEILKSESFTHLEKISQKAVESHAWLIVAVGGDGTVNCISRFLKNTSKPLYVIPVGSGNGFARHFNIPVNPAKAIRTIRPDLKDTTCDCGIINGHHFINVAGIGFDAHISRVFAGKNKRGLTGYMKAVFKELKYPAQQYHVTSGTYEWKGEAFLISIANGTQWGNNAMIAPEAKIYDGLLDLVIIKKFKWWQVPVIILLLFSGKLKKGSLVETHRANSFIIKRKKSDCIHTDGEAFETGKEIEIKTDGKLTVKV